MAAESTPSGPPEPPASVTVNGKEYPSLADGEYDAIVLGTGLKEVLLAGMLAREQGKRVLVIDRNGYYGGEAASLNVDELYRKFIDPKAEEASAEFRASLGDNRDYCVDLVPKFVMADGLLVKILLKMSAQDYVDFRLVDGSYVYKHATAMLWGKAQLLHKVPATQAEALATGLVSMWGKRGLKNFLGYIQAWSPDDPSTADGFDATTQTAAELYAKFGLDEGAIDFVGHAMALQDSDDYLAQPALKLIEAIKLYAYSLAAHSKSPYLYPVYGLSTLPEAFSRVCSLRGGIFMLNHDVSEVLFGEDGKVAGVRVGEKAATAPVIIADPSYAPADRKKVVGKTIRTIALMDHPVQELKDLGSAQVIIPQKQVKRAHDVYMTLLSRQHNVVAEGKYLAIISTVAETPTPQAEVAAGIELCGALLCRFDNITDTYVPVDDGSKDNFFVTSSLDATSHFESVAREVLDLWKRVTGTDFDLAPPKDATASGGSA